MHGRAPDVAFTVNGNNYSMGYYLTDGIYPEWQIFVKSISAPQGEKQKYFAEKQEGERKDVERGFAAIQVSFFLFFGFYFNLILLFLTTFAIFIFCRTDSTS